MFFYSCSFILVKQLHEIVSSLQPQSTTSQIHSHNSSCLCCQLPIRRRTVKWRACVRSATPCQARVCCKSTLILTRRVLWCRSSRRSPSRSTASSAWSRGWSRCLPRQPWFAVTTLTTPGAEARTSRSMPSSRRTTRKGRASTVRQRLLLRALSFSTTSRRLCTVSGYYITTWLHAEEQHKVVNVLQMPWTSSDSSTTMFFLRKSLFTAMELAMVRCAWCSDTRYLKSRMHSISWMKNTSNKRTNAFFTLKIFTGYFCRF